MREENSRLLDRLIWRRRLIRIITPGLVLVVIVSILLGLR